MADDDIPGLTLNSGPSFTEEPDEFRLAYRAPPQPAGIGSDARYPVAPPLGWNPPPLSPADRDLMIKTVYGEARGEPEAGQSGVAHAILNRVAAGNYGQGIQGVVMAPAQGAPPARGFHEFSPWNPPGVPEGQTAALNALPTADPRAYADLGRVVDRAYYGTQGDPTYGATHYYGRMPVPPRWAGPLAAHNLTKIGATTFVGRPDEGPGRIPINVATR